MDAAGPAISIWLAVVLGHPQLAGAAEGRGLQIQLLLDPCAEVDPAEVRRLLRIELDAELLLPDSTAPLDSARLAVTCEAGQVLLHVDDPITGKSLGRRLALLAAAATTRARLLALALAELLLASWAELSLDSSPAPATAARAPAPPDAAPREAPAVQARLAASEQVRRHTASAGSSTAEIGLQAALLSFPSEGISALYGGALRAAGDLRYRMHWQFELCGHYGTRDAPAGRLGAALFGVALALHYQHPLGAWRLRAGGGARVGAAWLRGQPSDASQVLGLDLWGPFAGPMLRFGAARRMPRRVTLAAELELGYAPVAVRGNIDGVRSISVEGLWLGILLSADRML